MRANVTTRFFFCHCCCFDVVVEVNNLGQKPGYDTYAEVTFKDQGGTCMAVGVDGSTPTPASYFKLRFDGGSEILGLIEACEFLAEELKRRPQRSVAEWHEREEQKNLTRSLEWAAEQCRGDPARPSLRKAPAVEGDK